MTRTAARPACWCAEAQQRLRAVAAAPAKRNPTKLKTPTPSVGAALLLTRWRTRPVCLNFACSLGCPGFGSAPRALCSTCRISLAGAVLRGWLEMFGQHRRPVNSGSPAPFRSSPCSPQLHASHRGRRPAILYQTCSPSPPATPNYDPTGFCTLCMNACIWCCKYGSRRWARGGGKWAALAAGAAAPWVHGTE